MAMSGETIPDVTSVAREIVVTKTFTFDYVFSVTDFNDDDVTGSCNISVQEINSNYEEPLVNISIGSGVITFYGMFLNGWEDTVTYVDKCYTNKCQSPVTIIASWDSNGNISNMPEGAEVYEFIQQDKPFTTRSYEISATYTDSTLNKEITETDVIHVIVYNDWERGGVLLRSYIQQYGGHGDCDYEAIYGIGCECNGK